MKLNMYMADEAIWNLLDDACIAQLSMRTVHDLSESALNECEK